MSVLITHVQIMLRWHSLVGRNFLGENGETRATLETIYLVTQNGEVLTANIRTADCDLLVHGSKCSTCKEYGSSLRAMYSRWTRKTSTASKYM